MIVAGGIVAGFYVDRIIRTVDVHDPHRGISQEKLSVYLGFFEFVHNVRKRGKALLGALIELLVT